MSVTTGDQYYAGSTSPLWIKLKGETNLWTEWFSRSDLVAIDTTTEWNQSLTNVGNVQSAIFLSRGLDGIYVRTVTVDSASYTFTVTSYGILLKNEHGAAATDACNYVKVNFINDTDTEYDFSEDCTFQNQLPTAEPTPNPTNSPTGMTFWVYCPSHNFPQM